MRFHGTACMICMKRQVFDIYFRIKLFFFFNPVASISATLPAAATKSQYYLSGLHFDSITAVFCTAYLETSTNPIQTELRQMYLLAQRKGTVAQLFTLLPPFQRGSLSHKCRFKCTRDTDLRIQLLQILLLLSMQSWLTKRHLKSLYFTCNKPNFLTAWSKDSCSFN